MIKVNFIYMNNKFEIKENKNTLLIEILKSYVKNINNDINDFYFLYKGKKLIIDNKLKIKDLGRKNNKVIISVFNINIKKYNNEINNIICPDCGNLALINFVDDKLIIDSCINNHKNIYFSINNLITNQLIYISKIKCDICKNYKYLYKEQFYKCSCTMFICGLCFNDHNSKNHNLVKYTNINSNCIFHSEEFISYCINCNNNLCTKCEVTHINHKIILYKEIKSNNKKIKETSEDILYNINNLKKYKDNIVLLNKMLNHIIINLNIDLNAYLKFYKSINLLCNNLKNYESIQNIINYNKYQKLNKEIIFFLKENIKNKSKYMIDICDINKETIIIEYNFPYKSKLRLFGETFVKNNFNNCYLLINNEISPIIEFYPYNPGYLKIILYKINNLIDLSYMLHRCDSVESIEFHKWDTKNTINMSHMFFGCKSLKTISYDYRWDINNVKDISFMFAGCSSLVVLPDISNWNTNNIKNMSMLFFCCSSLSSLPDISKWNTKNVKHLSFLFCGCKSLTSLPNISKWNPLNIIDMKQMFSYCELIKFIPDISHWDTSNVSDMSEMFYNCQLLETLPNISKWKTFNVTDMSYMFSDCKSLISIPDISNWDVSNVCNMYKMFYNCYNLTSIPDISKWNIHKVSNISFMFAKCSLITKFPDISKWNIDNVKNMSFLFNSCMELSLPDISSWNLDNAIHKSFIFSDLK